MSIPRSILARVEPEARDLEVVQGTWPEGLSGEVFVSAPHPLTLGPPHSFFGRGMVYRLSLQPGTFGAAPGTFAWRHALVDSPSARLQDKRPDVFRTTMVGVHSPFGFTNAANTAPMPFGDRLLCTWDVGRPVEVDPVSLRFLGEVGHRAEWVEMIEHPVLPMITSTAHPVVDPDRNCLWTVNTYFGQLFVVRWDGEGPVRRWPVAGAVLPQSVHTITQTREWLVVGDCAFKVEPQVLAGGDRTVPNDPDEPVYLIRKADLDAARPGDEVPCRVYRLAPEMNHYYARYDDHDGVVVLFEHTQNADIAMAQREGDVDARGRPTDPRLAGLYGFAMTPTRTTLQRFDPESGELKEMAHLYTPDGHFHTRQLSAFDWSAEGWERPEAVHTVYHGFRPEAVVQRMIDLYRDRIDPALLELDESPSRLATHSWDGLDTLSEWEFALEDFPTSPIFVPKEPGGDGRSRHAGERPGGRVGWVVCPVLNDSGFRVEVFDAADVGAGPVATLASPRHAVPFVLHSCWMPRAVPAPDVERTRFADELERVGALPDDLASAALEVAAELS